MQRSLLFDGQSLKFAGFFFIFLIAGRNHTTLKCKLPVIPVQHGPSQSLIHNIVMVKSLRTVQAIFDYIWARQRKTWVSPFSKISVAVFRPAIKNIKKNPKNARLGPSERWEFLVFYGIFQDHINRLFIFFILIWKTATAKIENGLTHVFRWLPHISLW